MPDKSAFDSMVMEISDAGNPGILHQLEVHRSFANHYRFSTDACSSDLPGLFVGLDFENARPPHLEALLDDPAECSVEPRIACREIPPEGDGGASSRGIFRDADAGRVHPSSDVRVRTLRIQREDHHLVRGVVAKRRVPQIVVYARTRHSAAVAEWNEKELCTARHGFGRHIAVEYVAGV